MYFWLNTLKFINLFSVALNNNGVGRFIKWYHEKKTKLEHMKPMGSLEMGGNLAERRKKLKQRSLYRKASEDDEKGFLYTIREEALEVYMILSPLPKWNKIRGTTHSEI
jgi:hypothetical protein